ncbi:MAG: hypothetical protein KTQ49_06445 [Candidatus Omnitrophica bacterium]|nr:hypothetical protein [Candidatus Omnitrophota bacterium]
MDRESFVCAKAGAGKVLFALVRDMAMASRVVKNAKALHITARNFDRAQTLLEHASRERPYLVILDLETCEVEAFRVLKELRENADLKRVPAVGVVTQERALVKPEAEKAGCLRVYLKTEFNKTLPDLIARYAQ